MQKLFIKNRKEQKTCVVVEESSKHKGLVFIMHGLGGFKEQPHLEVIAEAFKENSYTVITFDTTNSVGESDGDLVDATLTNYYEDLEDVIKWSETQSWYQEPFVLVGHSLGGISVALFAEKYPEKVKALAPISTVVSGSLTDTSPHFREVASEWEKNGIREWESSSRPGTKKRLMWFHIEDRRKYDLLPEVGKLQMPVLMIVGEFDDSTPLEHQQIFFDTLPIGKKELHIIKGAPHTFIKEGHIEEIKKIFESWLEKI
jgi:pimeloyl-ACP methyl ester carboxylesterase